MAITKFTDISDVSSIYETVVSQEADANLNTPRDLFFKKMVDKIDELTDLINTHITKMAVNDAKTSFPGFGTSNSTALVGDTKLIGIGSNTTISFGDLTLTPKGAYELTITATRDFGGKTGSQTKSVTLTLV